MSSMEFQSFEIKTEADSNDINECSHDVKPSTGIFDFFPAYSCSMSVPTHALTFV